MSKVVHLNSWALPHHCLQHLGQTPSEGKRRVAEALWRAECLKSDPGWKLIMACTWTMNRAVQPGLRCIVVSKIWSLLTLGPLMANFTIASGGTETSWWKPKGQVQQHIYSVKLLFAVLKSSSNVFAVYCYFLLLLVCVFTRIITQVEV